MLQVEIKNALEQASPTQPHRPMVRTVRLARGGRRCLRGRALCPMPPDKRNEGERDVPVRVQGLWVRPGDWLYADADGTVVMASAA